MNISATAYVTDVIASYIWSCDNHSVPRLTPMSANVQARRAGCVIALLKLIGNGTTAASLLRQDNNVIWKDIEWGATEGSKTGFHVKGESFLKHYLDFLMALNLISKEGILYRATSHGRILQQNGGWAKYNPDGELFAKRFLFLWTAISDPLSSITCIQLLRDSPKTLVSLTKDFHSALVENLKSFANMDLVSAKLISELNAASKALSHWKKPQVYSEHLVSSKINILLDLEIIKFEPKNKTYALATHSATAFTLMSSSDFVFSRYSKSVFLCNQLFKTPTPNSNSLDAMKSLCDDSKQASIKLIDFMLYMVSSLPTSIPENIAETDIQRKGSAKFQSLRARHNISTYVGQSYINFKKTSTSI